MSDSGAPGLGDEGGEYKLHVGRDCLLFSVVCLVPSTVADTHSTCLLGE